MTISSPIKDLQEIKLIKSLYRKKNQIRDLLLFTLAINSGFDLNTLLNLKVKDVKDKNYLLCENQKMIPLNNEILDLIPQVIKGHELSAPLFVTSRGSRIDRTTVFYSFKHICSELGLSKKYSVASWRKTFAYHHYQKYRDLSYLQWLFNQTTVQLTLRFIEENENMNLRFRDGVEL